jgi:hypothetical protein
MLLPVVLQELLGTKIKRHRAGVVPKVSQLSGEPRGWRTMIHRRVLEQYGWAHGSRRFESPGQRFAVFGAGWCMRSMIDPDPGECFLREGKSE